MQSMANNKRIDIQSKVDGTGSKRSRRGRKGEPEHLLRESEELFRTVVQQSADGIALVDDTGMLVLWNRALEALTGVETETVLGRPLWEIQFDLMPEDTRTAEEQERQEAVLRAFFASRTAPWLEETHEVELRHREGEHKTVQCLLFTIEPGDRWFAAAIVRDVTEKKRTDDRLLSYSKRLRTLASRFALAEERERRRIASELHDDVVQNLAMLKIGLDSLARMKTDRAMSESIGALRGLCTQTIDSTRDLIFELSPPILYDLGLVSALEWLAERQEETLGVEIDFHVDEGEVQPPTDVQVVLFQAVRELLTNIGKHTSASRAEVRGRIGADGIVIKVEDDGDGFDTSTLEQKADSIGYGLFNVGERLSSLGGSLDVHSSLGEGCSVTISIPLVDSPREGSSR